MSIEFEDLSGSESRKRRPNGWMKGPVQQARNAKGAWVLLDRYPEEKGELARGDATGVQNGYQTKQAANTDDLFDARIGQDDRTKEWVVEIRDRSAAAKVRNNITNIKEA